MTFFVEIRNLDNYVLFLNCFLRKLRLFENWQLLQQILKLLSLVNVLQKLCKMSINYQQFFACLCQTMENIKGPNPHSKASLESLFLYSSQLVHDLINAIDINH